MPEAKKFIKISELCETLNITDSSGKPLTHVIRYWEKEFKQINPKIIKNRRYYSERQVEVVRMVKFLLKDKGMTIKGAKNVLNLNTNKLDDYNSHSLKAEYYKKKIKQKSKKILEKISNLKKYGKKNTY